MSLGRLCAALSILLVLSATAAQAEPDPGLVFIELMRRAIHSLLVVGLILGVVPGLVGLAALVVTCPDGLASLISLRERMAAGAVRTLVLGLVVLMVVLKGGWVLGGLVVFPLAILIYSAAMGVLARSLPLGEYLYPGDAAGPFKKLVAGGALFLLASLMPVLGWLLFAITCLQGVGAWTSSMVQRCRRSGEAAPCCKEEPPAPCGKEEPPAPPAPTP
ncbi:MAG: hypothetical protein HY815_21315 [Candidatus Riflebacteria bacterium]|nr:hypothetical protein [Candidatus Riflebacteria bacterium]